MQPSATGGNVADTRPPALEWRPYGVLLLSGNTKVEKAAKEKLITVLSGSLTPRERGVFKVVKRVDLALDSKSDPDALAAAFYKILDQDRVEYTTPKPPPATAAVVPPLATAPSAAATPTTPPMNTAARPAAPSPNMSKRETTRKISALDASAESEPVEEDLMAAAEVALETDLRTGSPSHIYVFVDYPATVAEVKSLVTFKVTSTPQDSALNRPPTITSLIDGAVLMTVAAAKDDSRLDCGDGPTGGEAKPLVTLTKELKTLLANLAVDKLVFKTWLSSVQIIPVPTTEVLPEATQPDALQRAYADILDVLYEPSVGISAIVYAMTETVVKSFVKPVAPAAAPSKKKQSTSAVEIPTEKTPAPKRLSALLGLNIRLVKRYYVPDDTLLLAVHVETPQGRKSVASWSAADFVRYLLQHRKDVNPYLRCSHRPPFKEWRQENLLPQEYLTPRTIQAMGAVVSLSMGELRAVSESVQSLYPSDHSIIQVLRTPYALNWLMTSSRRVSVTATKTSMPSTDFPMTFHASFSDDSHLRIGRGQAKTIVLTYTVPSGLVLTVSSDGTIRQQYANSTTHAATPNEHEAYRVVLGKGTVVSTHKDGSQTIMYASGKAATRRCTSDRFVTVDEQGVVTGGGPSTVVQKEGYAEVSVDVEVNLTAQRHALGIQVAVTKGGIRTRSVVRTDDGTVIEIDYDTRVIASVNGIIRLRKPDGTVLVASDNGVVEFRPQSLSLGDAPPTPRRENEEELDTSTGAYYFNCATGSLQMNDPEHNAYHVVVGDGTVEPVVEVALAGVVTTQDCAKYDVPPLPVQAVVNDPLEPFLLLLHVTTPTTTLSQILRPSDVADYFRQVQRNAHVQRVPTMPPTGTHIYLHHLDRFEHNERWFADHHERRQLFDQVTIPARASPTILKRLHNTAPLQVPRVHIVRHIKEVTPFTPAQFASMLHALEAWHDWCAKREIAQDQYAVLDPRDSETMVATMAVQKKIQAAYKAARAKKKAERQKSKERDKHDADGDTNMSTLQEVWILTKVLRAFLPCTCVYWRRVSAIDDDEDEVYHALDDSDNDSRDELEFNVDDDYELTLNAFGQADTENTGRLNAVQTRRALVHALGTGVTQAEVNAAIPVFTECEDHRVTFEAFSRMLHAFREDQDMATLGDLPTPRGALLPWKMKSPRSKMPSPRLKFGGGHLAAP
ncbi:hypothetical protein B5M09_006871 [Aphanomyces astaci]|uniref:EF-hand domain-containing protein n=1 Tax=Aphanomyces astaci TaxID=112090 RepID=A0A425DF37_APHAT|nr:hypothetical protein B5M09_006871 [Aphanomyces astaci]